MSDLKERADKVGSKMKESFTELAKSQAAKAIGEAVIALTAQGQPLTTEALIAHLQQEARLRPDSMLEDRNAAAESALLEAMRKNCQ